jgi:glycosyltransferase involved in cell wall biosynthesis
MQTILRVGNFPTDIYPGAGYHIYKLQNLLNFKTIYISPILEGDPLELVPTDELRRFDNFLFKRKPDENKIFHLLKRIILAIKFNFLCILQLFNSRPDIVHIHSPYYLPVVWMAKIINKRCFLTYHGSDFNAVKQYRPYPILIKGLEKALYLGSHMQTGLEKIHGKGNILEVFNGVDAAKFNNIGAKREKHIIAVGSLKKEKGYEYLIKAFSELVRHDKYTEYKLIIAGEGILKQELETLTRALGIEKSMEFVGHLTRPETIKLYQSAELFVLSSISEGFPKVLLEAAASGCKIVSTDVGSVQYILGSEFNGLVPICDSLTLCEAMKKILNESRESSLDNIAQKFTWEKVSNYYQNIYTKNYTS